MEKRWEYCYPSGLEKTLCKWDAYVPLVTKGLTSNKLTRVEKNLLPAEENKMVEG